jgi:hypothetical protein
MRNSAIFAFARHGIFFCPAQDNSQVDNSNG